MALFLRHTPCPRCGSSDARAEYSDGSTHCFSCKHTSGSTRGFVEESSEKSYSLPDDLSTDFDELVYNWIAPTGLTYEELIKNGYSYSKRLKYLCRRVRTTSVGQIGCDIRRLHRVPEGMHKTPKSLYYGSKESAEATIQSEATGWAGTTRAALSHQSCEGVEGEDAYPEGRTSSWRSPSSLLVCCEDSLSSIKIARVTDSCALFGTKCSLNKLTRIAQNYDKVVIWLDSDKFGDSVRLSDSARALGKAATSIYSDLDPKYLDETTIYELLRNKAGFSRE